MYFALEQSTGDIASALRVDRSTAVRRLVAARQAVFDETRRCLRQLLPLATDEFASLAHAPDASSTSAWRAFFAEPSKR